MGALTFPIVVAHLPDDFSVSKEPSFKDPDLEESPRHEGLLLAPKDTFFFLHIWHVSILEFDLYYTTESSYLLWFMF